jgi:hypothetical protein
MRTLIVSIARLATLLALVATALITAYPTRAGQSYSVALPLIVAPTAGGGPVGSLPADLVGTWFSGQILNLSYYDRDSGVWGSAGGLGHMFVFAANGSYTRVSHLELGGGTTCVSSVDVYHTGTARAEAGQLLLTPSYARTRTVTCGTTTSDTEGPYDTTSLPWRVGEDAEHHTRLWLTEPQGETMYYRDGLGAQVVGAWANGDGGAIELYEPGTDTWADPTGESSVWYTFASDGSYRHGRVEAGFDSDPCRAITMIYEAGTLAGSGAQLLLQPTTVLRHTVSLCDPFDTVDEALVPGGQERWSWGFSASGETLNLLRVSSGFRQIALVRVP